MDKAFVENAEHDKYGKQRRSNQKRLTGQRFLKCAPRLPPQRRMSIPEARPINRSLALIASTASPSDSPFDEIEGQCDGGELPFVVH